MVHILQLREFPGRRLDLRRRARLFGALTRSRNPTGHGPSSETQGKSAKSGAPLRWPASCWENISDWPANPAGFRRINTLLHVLNGLLTRTGAVTGSPRHPQVARTCGGIRNLGLRRLAAPPILGLHVFPRHPTDDPAGRHFFARLLPRLPPRALAPGIPTAPRIRMDDARPRNPRLFSGSSRRSPRPSPRS